MHRIDGRSWEETKELLAQLIEEVSVLAANHRRPEPREIPRPGRDKAPARPETPGGGGHDAMLAAAMRRGMVRHV